MKLIFNIQSLKVLNTLLFKKFVEKEGMFAFDKYDGFLLTRNFLDADPNLNSFLIKRFQAKMLQYFSKLDDRDFKLSDYIMQSISFIFLDKISEDQFEYFYKFKINEEIFTTNIRLKSDSDVLTRLKEQALKNLRKFKTKIDVKLNENYQIVSYPQFLTDIKAFTFDSFINTLRQVNRVHQLISNLNMNAVINDLTSKYYISKSISVQFSELSSELLKDEFFNKSFSRLIEENTSMQISIIENQSGVLFNFEADRSNCSILK